MSRQPAPEAAVAQWFATRHGVVTRTEALRLGLTVAQIERHVATGAWSRLHRGVYALAGVARSPWLQAAAAVAAAGDRARLSHRSAAWAWGWIAAPPDVPVVTIPAGRRRQVDGVSVHRSRRLERPVLRRGIPCTPPERTLVDCAAGLPRRAVDDLVDDALGSPHLRVEALSKALARGRSGRLPALNGITAVRTSVEARGYIGGPEPSVLESRMARLLARCRAGRTLRPEVVWGPHRSYRLDLADPERRLVIEVDGYTWHRSPDQLRRNERRRNDLNRAGWTVLVYTWWDVVHDPGRVVDEITEEVTKSLVARPASRLGS